ncbi:MAG: twin-arginine translocation signal domain-containing protein, partial [Actinomycetota bacterium]
MLEDKIERAAIRLAGHTSRRSFLGRVGKGVVALAGGPLVAVALSPERAYAHHICGHLYTTNSCPHPFAPKTRLDRYGYPVHPQYGYP